MASSGTQAAVAELGRPLALSIATLATSFQVTSSPRSSTSSAAPQTPADLHAELAHYKDLFTKLRFSYTEQVTKERLLRSVVADPPDLRSPDEIVALEAKLQNDKTVLKEKKVLVGDLLEGLDERSRGVARHSTRQDEDVCTLAALPQHLADLETRIAELQSSRDDDESDDPRQRMKLSETNAAVALQKSRRDAVEAKLKEMREALQGRERDVKRLRAETEEVEVRKRKAIEEAIAVRGRKEGVMDGLEARGRWDRAAERILAGIAI